MVGFNQQSRTAIRRDEHSSSIPDALFGGCPHGGGHSHRSGAIEEKLRMEQESQRMQFVLQKERQEADRKRIEAQGIADFQKIVTLGISENLLRWKGIEATLKIAESNNAKVVIVGSGKDGLPVILDTK